ncbi:TPA: response regulator [Candidatus Poribacteria bacterium]|nr:response regulator [Candidatus Poribacteria bacterium]
MEDNGKRKAKILVVDDEPRNVRLLSVILKARGYDVLQGYSGEEALEKAETETPDLILLDIMMPRIDGYKVCKILRETEQTKAIPIVMITALHGLDEKIKALDIGADDFISKPFNKFEVLARIRTLLRVKYLHDELEAKNQILEDELAMAREVQQALLPKDIESQMPPGLEFDYKYIPTLAVGGDFFDIVKISPNVIGVFIADVMGHGAQPALITVLIKTLLSELVYKLQTPAELLGELNRRYNALVRQTGIFTSALYLTVDVGKQNIVFSNAGHPPALLINKEKLQLKELPNNSSFALGLAGECTYQSYERKLERGDTILLYTDGLSDIANQNGELFGLENLKSIVADNLKLQNTILIQTILNAIDAFTGNAPKPDDITVLAIGLS